MAKAETLGEVKSVTAGNGSEFLRPNAIRRILNCGVYYTRAYASWEKGSGENVNRMIRRWYPKGTDFPSTPTPKSSRFNTPSTPSIGNSSKASPPTNTPPPTTSPNPRERPLNMKILNALPPSPPKPNSKIVPFCLQFAG